MSPINQPSSFCPKPFEWFELHPGGEVFLCCPAWLKTPAGNLLEDSAAAIWNSPLAVEVRKTILNGSYHRCNRQRCPYLSGGRSFPDTLAAELQAAHRDGTSTLAYGPRTLNLCFDQSCNIACPSCRSEVQSSTGDARERATKLASKVLAELAPSTRELRLSGFGDPFASPVYRRLLQAVAPETFPLLKHLHLHSNGLLWDTSTWQSMSNLHPYLGSAEISIDAADAETYRLNRGADFERLLANLDFICNLSTKLTLSCVVQANNFRQIPTFVELARSYNAAAYFSPLLNWGTFSRQEFNRRAVHRPEHPEHPIFLSILHQVSSLEGVNIGSLHSLL